ncbi:pyroglutamyl-peptidase I [Arcanobacterium pinnipediorum]|uniref:Pyrrolidone-carboxylate peptidase n=1 Tax=Arcanobacterium pinnipediorum TaxID=1503041 RepID=A0ABY5AFJ3_9ACTO|nr:pyroglutamyl-peptidase I [Arcanobacterium pinnipediorum]USR78771.1 pyroglutamyl-peptidase I [Arcanobacterium pinnipediorum]
MRILITGFEPFGNDTENASWEAVSRLPEQISLADAQLVIERRLLPVEFGRGPAMLGQAIESIAPDAVICVGEAGGRCDITPEMRAQNSARASIADNSGHIATGEKLDCGPHTLHSRLPNGHIVEALVAGGYPASLSDDAGQYVCNAVFRSSLTQFAGPAGFIHVPALRSSGVASVGRETDANMPHEPKTDRHNLDFDDLAQALEIACRVVAQHLR